MDSKGRIFQFGDEDMYPGNMSGVEILQRMSQPSVNPPAQNGPVIPFMATTIDKLDSAIHDLTKVIRYPLMCPALFQSKHLKPIKGAILSGPPGTGKTWIAKGILQECNRYTGSKIAYFDVKLAVLLDGDVTSNLHRLFHAAELLKPSVLFVDEVDGLLEQEGIQQTLLYLIDGMKATDSVFILFATNKVEMLCDALKRPGRLEMQMEIGLPSYKDRLQWLRLFMENWGLTRADRKMIARSTEEFSPAELLALCYKAAMVSFERQNPSVCNFDSSTWILNGNIDVTPEDFDTALDAVKIKRPDPFNSTFS